MRLTDSDIDVMNTPQDTRYFEYRQIDGSYYGTSKLPLWLKNELPDPAGSILDYGCGFGQNMQALIDSGYLDVSGADVNLQALEACRDKGLNVRELPVSRLTNPFERTFDSVLLNHVLEHIPKGDMIETLRFIRTTLLNEKGKLLISVPNAQSNTGCYWAFEDFTHTTLFTSGSLYYVLRAAGFERIGFLDTDCTLGHSLLKKLVKKALLSLYRMQLCFWNKVTSSSYHGPSIDIFSYEIKAKAEGH